MAVIVATPVDLAVTLPEEETVATLVSLDTHVTSSVELEGNVVLKVYLLPTYTEAFFVEVCANVSDGLLELITVTLHLTVSPLEFVPVIVAVPALTPLILPLV